MLGSTSFQWYFFISVSCLALSHSCSCTLLIQTRTLVRCEALITQLVFEHALRIRVKAESENKPSSGSSKPEESRNTTPIEQDEAIVSGDETVNLHSAEPTVSREGTVQASSTSIKSTTSIKVKAKGKTSQTKEEPPESMDASNLVGKITNLVTTDLGNSHSSSPP
jgi:hypothetical protein